MHTYTVILSTCIHFINDFYFRLCFTFNTENYSTTSILLGISHLVIDTAGRYCRQKAKKKKEKLKKTEHEIKVKLNE